MRAEVVKPFIRKAVGLLMEGFATVWVAERSAATFGSGRWGAQDVWGPIGRWFYAVGGGNRSGVIGSKVRGNV